ncbi:MAG: PAS domain S-box protein [Pseudomonadota bacterium]
MLPPATPDAIGHLLHRMIESTSAFVGMTDTEGQVIYVNSAGLQITGATQATIAAGMTIADFHPRWATQIITTTALDEVRAHGEWQGETSLLTVAGNELPVLQLIVGLRPEPDADITHFATIALPVAEQLREEQALVERERLYRFTFDNAPVGIAQCGLDGQFHRVNDRLTAMLGIPAAELMATTVQAVSHAQDRAGVDKRMAELAAGQPKVRAQHRLIRADGTTLWTSIYGSLVSDEVGKPLFVIATFEDVSEVKTYERQLQLMLAELNHRTQNTLSIVQSMANQTLRRADDLASFNAGFQKRLHALGKTQGLLVASNWLGVELRALVEAQVLSDGIGSAMRVNIEGPEIRLPAAIASNLGIALHELWLNAWSHGAMSAPDGFLTIEWDVDHSAKVPQLHFRWVETGKIEWIDADDRGFGLTFLEEGIATGMGGVLELTRSDNELLFDLTLPLDKTDAAYFAV